jgi:hypothetical protein
MLDRIRSGLAAARAVGSERGRVVSRAEVERITAAAGAIPRSFELGALVADTFTTGAVDRDAAAPWIDFSQSGPNPWRTLGFSDAEYTTRLDQHFLRFEQVPRHSTRASASPAAHRVKRWEGEPRTLDRSLAELFVGLARGHAMGRAEVQAALRALPGPAADYLARRCDQVTSEKCLIRGWETLVREALLPDHDVTRARALIDDILASALPVHVKRRLARDYRAIVAGAPELLALWPPSSDATYPIPPALLEGATGRFFAPWLGQPSLARDALTAFLGHAWTRHTHLEVGRASERLGRHASRVGCFLSQEHFLRVLGPVWEEFEKTYATPQLLARSSFSVGFDLEDVGFTTGWSTAGGARAQLHRGVTVVIEKHAKTGLIGLKTCYPSGSGAAFEMT